MSSELTKDGIEDLCEHFQVDLSCLVDGELDERAAGGAMMHLEECELCRSFFDDTRLQLRLHKDSAEPDRLFARFAVLTGAELAAEAEGIDLVHRLATIFYQLGKAYVLAAIDADFRTRVFEKAVSVEPTRRHGRGFVDGVLSGGKTSAGGVDWNRARTVLNGRLERIEDPLDKGRRLLEEAIAADPSHEEARLYLAFLHAHEGKRVLASDEYRAVFDTAIDENNRGHAAIQLGRLYSAEGQHRCAAQWFRWITLSGLADRESRFWVSRFNLGMMYAHMRRRERSLAFFRELLDRHPDRAGEVAGLFARSPRLRESIDEQSGFAEALASRCPELFASAGEDLQ
jgi:tetratricopeptide (TPR) repeat protein